MSSEPVDQNGRHQMCEQEQAAISGAKFRIATGAERVRILDEADNAAGPSRGKHGGQAENGPKQKGDD